MKLEEDVKNPKYYNRAGYQPIDFMKCVFTKEQYEGFVWGNVLKYAFRYGQKGSKKDTAIKIQKYAEWLEELNNGND